MVLYTVINVQEDVGFGIADYGTVNRAAGNGRKPALRSKVDCQLFCVLLYFRRFWKYFQIPPVDFRRFIDVVQSAKERLYKSLALTSSEYVSIGLSSCHHGSKAQAGSSVVGQDKIVSDRI